MSPSLSDINECKNASLHNCSLATPGVTCLDTHGGFQCTCKEGFTGNGVTCNGLTNSFSFLTTVLYNLLFLLINPVAIIKALTFYFILDMSQPCSIQIGTKKEQIISITACDLVFSNLIVFPATQ